MNAFQTWLPSDVVNSAGPLLLDISIKATVVLLIAGALAAMLGRASAAIRHRIWCLACCGLLVLPVLTLTLPSLRIPILPETARSDARPRTSDAALRLALVPNARPVVPTAAAAPAAPRMEANIHTADQPFAARHRGTSRLIESPSPIVKPTQEPLAPQPSDGIPWTNLVALVWLFGSVFTAMPLLYGFISNRRLGQASRTVEDTDSLELMRTLRDRLGLRRPVRLLETSRAIIPMTWGVVRPIVLFPAAWQDWSESRRRLVLLHELAHVQRHDVAFQVLARLACALYWFHPLAWYALRRMRIERELACDDCVLMTGERPSEYAGQLLEIARAYQPFTAPTAVAAVQRTSLEQRIRALLDKARSHVPLGRTTGRILLLSSLCLIIGVAVVKPGRATDGADAAVADQEDVNKSEDENVDRETNPKRTRGTKESATEKTIILTGQVLDPNGTPHRQASVWVQRPFPAQWTRIASTDKNGQFNASIDRARLDAVLAKDHDAKLRIAATAEGCGLAWARVEASALEEITLKLSEETPIEGRIVTLEGKPAVGVTVRVDSIPVEGKQDVDKFIKTAPGSSGIYYNSVSWQLTDGGPGIEPVVTDAAGRFRIESVGAERVVRLEAAGGSIGATRLAIVTRPAPPGTTPNGAIAVKEGLRESVYYAQFTHVAVPGRTLQGVVTDEKTGSPLAGVRIRAMRSWHSLENPATTGEDGRYKITGVSKREKYELLFESQSSRHFNKEMKIPDTSGLEPITVDVALRTGITVRGRVTDAKTGEPLSGTVIYNPLFPNENVLKLGEKLSIANPAATESIQEDGTYEISVLPGPGAIAVEVSGEGYVSASVNAERLREIVGEGGLQSQPNAHGEFRHLSTAAGPQAAAVMGLDHYHAAVIVNPPEDAKEQTIDLTAVRGRSRRGTIKDEAGRPLVGVKVIGLGPSQATVTWQPLETAEFTVEGLAPDRKRTLLFVHQQRELGTQVVVTGDEAAPLTVRMMPTGTLIGRFVDEFGNPLPGIRVELTPQQPPLGGTGLWHAEADEEGRFRITGLIDGATYHVQARSAQEPGPPSHVQSDVRVESGKILDLGTYTRKDQYQFRRVGEKSVEPGKKPASVATPKTSLRGRVLDPDGKPIGGVDLYWFVYPENFTSFADVSAKIVGRTNADGRFDVSVPTAGINSAVSQSPLIASAPGYGLAGVGVRQIDPAEPMTLQLVEDIPIRGRILTSEGQPVQNLKLNINRLFASSTGSADAFLKAFRSGRRLSSVGGMDLHVIGPLASILDIQIHNDGTFEIRGVGAERLVMIEYSGDGIAAFEQHVVVRDGIDLDAINREHKAIISQQYMEEPVSLVGPEFTIVAETGRAIEGIVRNLETGEPLAGVIVSLITNDGSRVTETNSDGRFRIEGVPYRDEYLVSARMAGETEFLERTIALPEERASALLNVELGLRSGIVVTGRVLDRDSDSGVESSVSWTPLIDNPQADKAGFDGWKRGRLGAPTDKDGNFRLVLPPGPGMLSAQILERELIWDGQSAMIYREVLITEEDRERIGIKVGERQFRAAGGKPEMLWQGNRVIETTLEDREVSVDIFVDRGETTEIEIVDPQGEAVRGAFIAEMTDRMYNAFRTPEARNTIYALDPDKPRTIYILHPTRHLAGRATLTGKEPEVVRVSLKPTGTLSGRVLLPNGAPMKNAIVGFAVDGPERELYEQVASRHERPRTDDGGRFRIENVLPGMTFRLGFLHGSDGYRQKKSQTLKTGEHLDLETVALE